jgi:sulfur-carrier protein
MGSNMKITLRYFASLREALGPGEALQLPDTGEVLTLGELRDHLIARGGRHAEALARGRAVRCAMNQNMGEESQALVEGAEVAFFPPVTGG